MGWNHPFMIGWSKYSLGMLRLQGFAWRRYQMETLSALLAICAVPGEFPQQRPVTRSFDVFMNLHPNKRLSKQWWGWWFETTPCPLRRHRNVGSRDRWEFPLFFKGHCEFLWIAQMANVCRKGCARRLWLSFSLWIFLILQKYLLDHEENSYLPDGTSQLWYSIKKQWFENLGK